MSPSDARGLRPLRLALVSDWFAPRRGGIEVQVAGLAAALRAAGHTADVLTPTPGPADGVSEPGVIRLDVRRLPGAGIAYTPALPRALARALGAGGYDVVHAHASVISPAAFAAVRVARRHGVRAVVSFHSVLDPPTRALAARVLRPWARDPDVLLAGVSTVVAGQLRRALRRVPGAPVGVLPNGVDLAWWGAEADDAPDRPSESSGRSGGELRLVTAMRLVRKKRPLALLAVAAALRDAAPAGRRVRLITAGDGRERGRLERAAHRAGVADVLDVLGWQSRDALRALYRSADAFVLPTVRESFGIAALEARAAGLPVLGRAGTGLGDFVTPGVDGWLCATDAALAAQAAAWARAPESLGAMRRASAARPPRAFGWAAVVAAHVTAYRTASHG